MYPYIFSDDTITILVRGKPYTHPKTDEFIAAISSGDTKQVDDILTAVERMAQRVAAFGNVEVFNGHVTLNGKELHGYLIDKIVEMGKAGMPIEPLANFLERVQRNPSFRARNDLYEWLEASGLPIYPDGRFVAYRLITNDYKDIRTRSFDNSVGATVKMDRGEVDENPDQTCSHGLHFCSAKYLPHYGGSNSRVVLVAICPSDVVAFPRDYGLAKGRCCEYEVMEEIDKATASEFFTESGFVYHGDEEGEFEFNEDYD